MPANIAPYPDVQTVSPYAKTDSKQLHEAADRALDHYLGRGAPESSAARKPSGVFIVAPDVDRASLLTVACESLATANQLMSSFSTYLEGSQRHTAAAVQQIIMLAELALNRLAEPPGVTGVRP